MEYLWRKYEKKCKKKFNDINNNVFFLKVPEVLQSLQKKKLIEISSVNIRYSNNYFKMRAYF